MAASAVSNDAGAIDELVIAVASAFPDNCTDSCLGLRVRCRRRAWHYRIIFAFPRRVFGMRDRCAKDPRSDRALKGPAEWGLGCNASWYKAFVTTGRELRSHGCSRRTSPELAPGSLRKPVRPSNL